MYPKPVKLIKRILTISGSPNSVVLDYFAGSGTTAQAVLEMNVSDGGNRRFVLITNDDNGICSSITKPRIERVIEGYSYQSGNKVVNVAGTGGEFVMDLPEHGVI